MPLLKAKPTSAGRRHVVQVVNPDLHKGAPYAPLLEKNSKSGGRNNNGRITTRHIGGGHKQHYRGIDFKRDKFDVPAVVERPEYDPNRSAHLALLKYADGERRYIIAPNKIKVGDIFSEEIVNNLTRTQIVQYAGVSGDYNPIHTDEIFATEVAGYPSVFAHGMLTMGMTGKMITNLVGDGNLKNFGVRFTNQVWPGDTLTTKAEVKSIETISDKTQITFEVITENQNNIPVITGSAKASI